MSCAEDPKSASAEMMIMFRRLGVAVVQDFGVVGEEMRCCLEGAHQKRKFPAGL